MSTRGIAYHCKGTFPQLNSEDTTRATRFAAQDAAYRVALGLGVDDPLPSRLGRITSSGGRRMPQATGGTKRGRGGFGL